MYFIDSKSSIVPHKKLRQRQKTDIGKYHITLKLLTNLLFAENNQLKSFQSDSVVIDCKTDADPSGRRKIQKQSCTITFKTVFLFVCLQLSLADIWLYVASCRSKARLQQISNVKKILIIIKYIIRNCSNHPSLIFKRFVMSRSRTSKRWVLNESYTTCGYAKNKSRQRIIILYIIIYYIIISRKSTKNYFQSFLKPIPYFLSGYNSLTKYTLKCLNRNSIVVKFNR